MSFENITVYSFFNIISKFLCPMFKVIYLSIENLHTVLNLVFSWFLIVIHILSYVLVLTEVGHAIVELHLVEEGLIFETEKLIVFSLVLEEEVPETLLQSGELLYGGDFTELLNVLDFSFVLVLHEASSLNFSIPLYYELY